MKQGNRRMEALSYGALLITVIVWGMGLIFVQMGLDAGLMPGGIMAARFAIGALIMAVFFGRKIRALYKPGQWRGAVLSGLFLFGAFALQTYGQMLSTPANSAFIVSAYVVLVPFVWWAVSKKRPSLPIFIASALCLCGIAILSITPGAGFSASLGDIFLVLSALCFASQIVVTGLYAPTIHQYVLLFIQLLVAAVLSAILFFITDGSFAAYKNPTALISVAYLGVLSTFLCYFLQTFAQKWLESSKVAIVLSFECLIGAVCSVLVGYDPFSPRMVAGGLVMLAAILLPELCQRKKPSTTTEANKQETPP